MFVLATPYITNAPAPNDPVYPALTDNQAMQNIAAGAVILPIAALPSMLARGAAATATATTEVTAAATGGTAAATGTAAAGACPALAATTPLTPAVAASLNAAAAAEGSIVSGLSAATQLMRYRALLATAAAAAKDFLAGGRVDLARQATADCERLQRIISVLERIGK